jgi:putative transposase
MARKKRHSHAEIAAKLAQAEALAAGGKLQPEIAQVLGISVMTLHRWRKAEAAAGTTAAITGQPMPSDQENHIADLQLENSRLRRLVTDLLLERMKLDEASKTQKLPGKFVAR